LLALRVLQGNKGVHFVVGSSDLVQTKGNNFLIEGITIGGFLQWLFVIALKLFSAQAPKEGI